MPKPRRAYRPPLTNGEIALYSHGKQWSLRGNLWGERQDGPESLIEWLATQGVPVVETLSPERAAYWWWLGFDVGRGNLDALANRP